MAIWVSKDLSGSAKWIFKSIRLFDISKIETLCGRPKPLRNEVKIYTRPSNGMHNNIPNVHFATMGHPIDYQLFLYSKTGYSIE